MISSLEFFTHVLIVRGCVILSRYDTYINTNARNNDDIRIMHDVFSFFKFFSRRRLYFFYILYVTILAGQTILI